MVVLCEDPLSDTFFFVNVGSMLSHALPSRVACVQCVQTWNGRGKGPAFPAANWTLSIHPSVIRPSCALSPRLPSRATLVCPCPRHKTTFRTSMASVKKVVH